MYLSWLQTRWQALKAVGYSLASMSTTTWVNESQPGNGVDSLPSLVKNQDG